MKRILILLLLISTSFVVRADLVIRQQAVRSNTTNNVIISIHGDKIRTEQLADQTGRGGVIYIDDLATHDSAMLMPKDKTVMRNSGANLKSDIEAAKKAYGETNAMFLAPPLPVDTGKTEVIENHKTEVYSWNGLNGTKETLWVAGNFPNHDNIKADLDKLDEWNSSFVGKGLEPDLRLLPGMVVKKQTAVGGRTDNGQLVTISLVSVKIEPVDPTIFEVPSDYTESKP
ncbi:MAG TPA: hypothetical protein VIK35_13000 [Verrucomicrobiae bacterium]